MIMNKKSGCLAEAQLTKSVSTSADIREWICYFLSDGDHTIMDERHTGHLGGRIMGTFHRSVWRPWLHGAGVEQTADGVIFPFPSFRSIVPVSTTVFPWVVEKLKPCIVTHRKDKEEPAVYMVKSSDTLSFMAMRKRIVFKTLP